MKKNLTIKQLLHRANILMIVLALLPLVTSIMIYTRHLLTYENSIDNIARANEIAEIVDDQLLEEAWSLTYGQISPTSFTQDNALLRVQEEINMIRKNTETVEENSTLNVVLRSLDNLSSYLDQIVHNLESDRSFSANQRLMIQVDSSIDLVHDIIQDFVEVEINLAAARSQEVKQSLIVLSLIEVLIICLIIFSARRANRNLITQIQEPLEEMVTMSNELATGHLNHRVKEMPTNELAVLSGSLNSMADNLVVLLEENALKQYNLAQSEVRTLQAQITPHFIYNSLDAILALSEEGEIETVQKMTYALSDFFRISLSKGQDWITVEKEINHITDYLVILKIRYGDALCYSIDVAENMQEHHMLKMILQPIVENAVYHGTKLVRHTGVVTVEGYLDDDSMHFLVKDNGIGIPPEKLRKIQTQLAHAEDTEFTDGYGLFNVNKRLMLYYGREAALMIDSIYQAGTTVEIILPTKERSLPHV